MASNSNRAAEDIVHRSSDRSSSSSRQVVMEAVNSRSNSMRVLSRAVEVTEIRVNNSKAAAAAAMASSHNGNNNRSE